MSAILDRLGQYDVSLTSGFLPPKPLLIQLPQEYAEWERLCAEIPNLISSELLDEAVANLPLLSTDGLTSSEALRRAHVILGFIANAYLWGTKADNATLPASVAIPFLAVSDSIKMPPVPTYAAENLWNFRLKDPKKPMDLPENIEIMASFTGLQSEAWFYSIPTVIEARGGPLIREALNAIAASQQDSPERVSASLRRLASKIVSMTSLLVRMYDQCDPDEFYNKVRPFLSGTISARFPNGKSYETVKGQRIPQTYSGPTAAQSSLFHFLDIVLGIEHHPTGESKISKSGERREEKFLKEMRAYMPEPHRRFLEHVADLPKLRVYVQAPQKASCLRDAYDQCLKSLAEYRNKHVQVVTRYVIVPARAAHKKVLDTEPGTAGRVSSTELKEEEPAVLGTGGSAPIQFLKQVREETHDAIIGGTV